MLRKLISLILCLSLFSTQVVLAEMGQTLNLSPYLNQGSRTLSPLGFQPPVLRYFSYDLKADNFQLLLDPQDLKDKLSEGETKGLAQEQLNYFLVGLTLPNSKFWVNLRPDAPDNIIEPELEQTEVGRIMLAADLQLKKDTALFTSPQTKEGREYWDKLYQKTKELFGSEPANIPTITRPWIVPGEILIREDKGAAYVYKATLKVMLEEDYLKSSQLSAVGYQHFKDPRMKELNSYSSQLIRELILPKLTQEVNSGKNYAPLRQVYFSLVLSRWFKQRFQGQSPSGTVPLLKLIDSGDLTNLTSKEPWSKETYFKEYQKSFEKGEYQLKEQVTTPTGQVIRSYVSGGTWLEKMTLGTFSFPLAEIGGFQIGGRDWAEIVFSTLLVISTGLYIYLGVFRGARGARDWNISITRQSELKSGKQDLKGDISILLNALKDSFYVFYGSAGYSLSKKVEERDKIDKKMKEILNDLKGSGLSLWIKRWTTDYQSILLEIVNSYNLDTYGRDTEYRKRDWSILLNQLTYTNAEIGNIRAQIKGRSNFPSGSSPLTLENWKEESLANLKKLVKNIEDDWKELSDMARGAFPTSPDDIWGVNIVALIGGNRLEDEMQKLLNAVDSIEGLKHFIEQTESISNKIDEYRTKLNDMAAFYSSPDRYKETPELYAKSLSRVNFAQDYYEKQEIEIVGKVIEASTKFLDTLLEEANNFLQKRGGVSSALKVKKHGVQQPSDQLLDPQGALGGIDFTDIEKYLQYDGSFKGIDLSLPLLSKAELERLDPQKELQDLNNLLKAGIRPSDDRLRRYLAGLFQKDQFSSQQLDLLRLAQELCSFLSSRGLETSPDQRAFILIADTGIFLRQGQAQSSIKPTLN